MSRKLKKLTKLEKRKKSPNGFDDLIKTGITPVFDKKQELNSGSGPWDPKEAERLVEQPITIA